MSDGGLKDLERQHRSEMGNVLGPEGTRYRKPVSGEKASVVKGSKGEKLALDVRDPEVEKGAWFEAGAGGGITTSRGLDGAVTNLVYGTGDMSGGVVDGPEKDTKLDDWSGDGLIDVKPTRYREIRSRKRQEAVNAFISNWKDNKLPDADFVVEMNADKNGKLWVETDRDGKQYKFPVWMLTKVLNVGRKRTPETEVTIKEGEFASVNRSATQSMWQKLINRLVIDEVRRPKIKVELTGPWDKEKNKQPVVEAKKEVKYKVAVNLDMLGGGSKRNKTRKEVARAIGLMEMRSGKPSFKVKEVDGKLVVKVENGGAMSKEVNVKDLMRVIPEVSSMIDENRKWHWSLNGMSVDATSSPEDWRRLFGSMAIKGRIKKKA
jgi:hypothetical protein